MEFITKHKTYCDIFHRNTLNAFTDSITYYDNAKGQTDDRTDATI